MRILSIESSAVAAGAAVIDNGKLLGEAFSNVKRTHSQTLLPMVQNVLENTGTNIADVDVIAVSNGPGSFTGVRIGVALAKGLSDGMHKSCFAVSTLEAIAYPCRDSEHMVCAVMDARCAQVYAALFKNGKRLSKDRAISIEKLSEKIKDFDHVMFVGDGAEVCYDTLKDKLRNISVASPQFRYQHASSVAFLAEEKIAAGAPVIEACRLLPQYLRMPQAERELRDYKRGRLK